MKLQDQIFLSHKLQPDSKRPDSYQFSNLSSPIPGPSVQPVGSVTPPALVYGQHTPTGKEHTSLNNN